jgi:hypothetical protein
MVLTEKSIDQMLPLYESTLHAAFKKKFKGSDIAYGKNLLLVSVASILVKKYLGKEKEIIRNLKLEGSDIVVSFLEKPMAEMIDDQVLGDKMLDVKLKGFVDRIDKIGIRMEDH